MEVAKNGQSQLWWGILERTARAHVCETNDGLGLYPPWWYNSEFWIAHRNRNSLQWLVDVNAEDPSERGKSHESWVQHLVTAIWKGITPILHQTFPLEPGLSLFGIHQSLWQNTKRSKIRIIVVFLAKLCIQWPNRAKIIACDPPGSLHRSRECGDRPGQPGWCGEVAGIVGFRQQVSRPPLCILKLKSCNIWQKLRRAKTWKVTSRPMEMSMS